VAKLVDFTHTAAVCGYNYMYRLLTATTKHITNDKISKQKPHDDMN